MLATKKERMRGKEMLHSKFMILCDVCVVCVVCVKELDHVDLHNFHFDKVSSKLMNKSLETTN